MRSIQIDLPDQLADDAQKAGLLSTEKLEAWLRQELKARSIDNFFAAMDRAAAVPDPPYMSPEELAPMIRAMRAEKQANALTLVAADQSNQATNSLLLASRSVHLTGLIE